MGKQWGAGWVEVKEGVRQINGDGKNTIKSKLLKNYGENGKKVEKQNNL